MDQVETLAQKLRVAALALKNRGQKLFFDWLEIYIWMSLDQNGSLENKALKNVTNFSLWTSWNLEPTFSRNVASNIQDKFQFGTRAVVKTIAQKRAKNVFPIGFEL